MEFGYIYIRRHYAYDIYNTCKLGKTVNIIERDQQYRTGEVKSGYFSDVYRVDKKQLNIIDNLLKHEFKNYNVKYNGGTEFYDKEIITLVEKYFISIGIYYKKLDKNYFNKIKRKEYIKNKLTRLREKIIYFLQNIRPRLDQIEIIEKSVDYFKIYDKGILELICGLGKTLISLWIAEKLKVNSILIGVFSRELIKQWKETINKILYFSVYKIVIISNNISEENILKLLLNNKKIIVICLYQSSHRLLNILQNVEYIFDLKILDECHHVTTNNYKKDCETIERNKKNRKNINILSILSLKQLGLTATKKIIDDDYIFNSTIISNNSLEYFGYVIEKRGLYYGIRENLVCDYNILVIGFDDKELDKTLGSDLIVEYDKNLMIACLACLKRIEDGLKNSKDYTTHILIYCNSIKNLEKVDKYINILNNKYFGIDLYYSAYSSLINQNKQKQIIKRFSNSKIGILSTVYCLGEGFDLAILDCVVFAENMYSNIRILQSALRSGRKCKEKPNKINNIIIPILFSKWYDSNGGYEKIKKVVYEMVEEDASIYEKIKVIKNYLIDDNINSRTKHNSFSSKIDCELTDELVNNLKIENINKQNIYFLYSKSVEINKQYNIQSREEYYNLCNILNKLPKEPEKIYKQFSSWFNYFGIDKIYYDLETCQFKLQEYLRNDNNLVKYILDLEKLCILFYEKDNKFPPPKLWCDYYKVENLSNIFCFTKRKQNVIF